jgi:hypothetical protein
MAVTGVQIHHYVPTHLQKPSHLPKLPATTKMGTPRGQQPRPGFIAKGGSACHDPSIDFTAKPNGHHWINQKYPRWGRGEISPGVEIYIYLLRLSFLAHHHGAFYNQFFCHLAVLSSHSSLEAHGIDYRTIVRGPGEARLTRPAEYHTVFSLGEKPGLSGT